MASDPPVIGADTAASCWLCDRDRGELCHVHAPIGDDREAPAVVVDLAPQAEAP